MGLISYILNTDSRRSLKKIDSQAEKILALAPKYEGMTDAELKDQTLVLKDRLKNGETLDQIMYDAFAVVRERHVFEFHVSVAVKRFRSPFWIGSIK